MTQPVTYIAPTDSSIATGDEVIVTGASQGTPVVFIEQNDPIVISASQWVA